MNKIIGFIYISKKILIIFFDYRKNYIISLKSFIILKQKRAWHLLLSKIKGEIHAFQNISVTNDNWLNPGGIGVLGLIYTFVLTGMDSIVELVISKFNAVHNKHIFDD